MKISIERNELVKKISMALRAVPSQSSLSILTNLHVETDAFLGEIGITGYNLELGIKTYAEGSILEEGQACINAKLLNDIVKKLPDGPVVIEANPKGETDADVIISSGKAVFKVPGKKGDDYPVLPEIEDAVCAFDMDQAALRDMIRQVGFCASTVNTNALMCTINMRIVSGELRCTAMDGHRIGIRKAQLAGTPNNVDVNLPIATMNELYKLLGSGKDSTISVKINDKLTVFETESLTIVSRLVDGSYFKVDQFLSDKFATKVVGNREDVISTVERCELLLGANDKRPLVVKIGDREMEMSLNTTMGSLTEMLEVEKQGGDLTIGLNPVYVREALSAIDDEKVNVFMLNSKSPVTIKNDNNKGMWDYYYLILPINIMQASK